MGIKWYPETYGQPRGCWGLYLETCAGVQGEPSTRGVLRQADSGNARALPSLCMGHRQLKPTSGGGRVEERPEANPNFVHLLGFLVLEHRMGQYSQELSPSVLLAIKVHLQKLDFWGGVEGRVGRDLLQLPWLGGEVVIKGPGSFTTDASLGTGLSRAQRWTLQDGDIGPLTPMRPELKRGGERTERRAGRSLWHLRL